MRLQFTCIIFLSLLCCSIPLKAQEIAGCLDPSACNYNPQATVFSNCIYPDGCTNPVACNYDYSAVCNDNSCIFQSSLIYADEIDDCSLWIIENAGAPYSPDVNFQCGTDLSPMGSYPISTIESSTYDNGILLVDSDLGGGNYYCENTWAQRVLPFDLTSYSNVKIGFQNYYRDFSQGCESYLLLELSRDGFTWPNIETFTEAEGMVDFGDGDGLIQARWELFSDFNAIDYSQNPEWTDFDISEIADGEQVWIRFRWVGSWSYAWMIDDIAVFESPENDIALINHSYADTYVSPFEEYSVWHPSQSAAVNLTADIVNEGILNQTNILVSTTENGSLIGSTSIDLVPGATQSISIPYAIPINSGFYDIIFDASLSEDACPGNNTKSKSFEVPGAFENTITGTGGQYAKDDGEFNDPFFSSLTTEGVTLVATDYEFYGDSQIHAIQAAIIGENLDETQLQAVILVNNVLNNPFELEPIAFSTTHIPVPDELINTEFESPDEIKWMRFAFNPPIDVSEGDIYFAGIESGDGFLDETVSVGIAQDGSQLRDGMIQQYDDYYSITNIPMIRFNLDPSSAASTTETCKDPTACNYDESGFYNNASLCVFTIEPNVDVISVSDCGQCNGSLEIDQLNGYEEAFNYQWFDEAGQLLSEEGPEFNAACTGEAYYAVISSTCDPVTTNSVTVDNISQLNFSVNNLLDPAACGTDNNFMYYASINDSFSGDQWVEDNTVFYLDDASNVLPATCEGGQCSGMITQNPIETTTYTIGMIYTDSCGEVYEADSTFTIHVISPDFDLEIDANPTSGDTPLTVTFDNQTPDDDNYTFTWDFGDGTVLEDNGSFVQHTYTSGGLWDVTLTAVDNATGCVDVLFNAEYIWSLGDGCPQGCTDSSACNYDPNAECDDDSCLEFDECGECGGSGTLGCMDSSACNYNETANCDDGLCYYTPELFISGPNVITAFTSETYETLNIEGAEYEWSVTGGVIENNDDSPAVSVFWASEGIGELCVDVLYGVCESSQACISLVITPGNIINGCTDTNACNYDPNATTDNGTCIFIGDSCDDSNPNTEDDEIQENCECSGNSNTIVDELEALSVLVYPNPASHKLTIELGDLNGVSTAIKLYDSSSKLVFEKQSSSTLMIDVSGFSQGMYSLELATGEQVFRSQVIID